MTKYETTRRVAKFQQHNALVVDVYTTFDLATAGQLADMFDTVERAAGTLAREAGGTKLEGCHVEQWGKYGCRVFSVVHLPTSTVYKKHSIEKR